MISTEEIYRRTQDGLDIILYYYPQATEVVGTQKKFKMRDEKTPSATLRQFSGVWKVTDFGDDQHAMGPLDIVMREERCSFPEAIAIVANRYGIEKHISKEFNRADIQKRPAHPHEESGAVVFEFNDEFTDQECKVMGPKVTNEHLKAYGWKSVKCYHKTKEKETTTISSNESYPIFLRECGAFQKVYQPLNPEKQYRFFYVGEKPKKYINGLDELKDQYTKYNDRLEEEFYSDPTNEEKPYKYSKIPEAIICSGERDAICVASLGFFPLWFNSETYRPDKSEIDEIFKYVDELYNIPDIDETGIRKGTELAMEYIDIKTIWLPRWLSNYKDLRGRPRKDFRDFTEIRPTKAALKGLMTISMPMRFWEVGTDERGRKRTEINTEYLYHFLRYNGFVAINNKNVKSGKTLARIQNNVVKEIIPKEIFYFLKEFARERQLPIEIHNLINNSTRASDSYLERLYDVDLEFCDFTPDTQTLFFRNAAWVVSSDGIVEHKTMPTYVWDDEVSPYNVKRSDPAFMVHANHEEKEYEIDVLNAKSCFFRFLINASRIHWQKELEENIGKLSEKEQAEYLEKNRWNIAGQLLTEEEQAEQMHHLVNKIFCIGYLLHRYKSDSRAWCVFAMDAKIGAEGESNGRSGKSFAFKALRKLMKSVTLSGKNKKLTDNPHIYERVTEHTDMVLIDDADEYMDFTYFFDVVTGDLTVNPKNNKSFEIPFELAPKFVITSNFTLRNINPSTDGRILYTVFSDYYHQKSASNDYKDTRSIYDDFGMNLLTDYTPEQWNDDLNFFADCLQFYLSTVHKHVKLQPPMDNVTKRNALTVIKETFLDWADVYFSPESGHIDCFVNKQEAFNDFLDQSKVKLWTMQSFTRSLKAYCKFADHIIELNPEECMNAQGRIIRKGGDGKAAEFIYVRTKSTPIPPKEFDNDEPLF